MNEVSRMAGGLQKMSNFNVLARFADARVACFRLRVPLRRTGRRGGRRRRAEIVFFARAILSPFWRANNCWPISTILAVSHCLRLEYYLVCTEVSEASIGSILPGI